MIEVAMPQMGESLAEGTVVRWLKRPGDRVGRDEPLFEISTDKVDTNVPSPAAGVLKEILVKEGETVLVGAAVALIGGQAPERRAGGTASGGTLDALATGLASGRLAVVDLSKTLASSTRIIQLPPPFANTPGFKIHEISHYDAKGPAWYWNWIEVGEHVGTHFDAPCHWVTCRDKPCVDQLAAKQFIGPAAVVDATADVAKNPDFVATRATLMVWEQKHGRIPRGAWVILRTGWGVRAIDQNRFMNVGAGGAPHYPGFGKESAEFLTKERDILGVGVEQVGTDAAVGAKADPAFPNHSIMHGAGKLGLTQLANLDKLPERGAIVIAAPLKIEHGSGSPVRPIAIVPAGGGGD